MMTPPILSTLQRGEKQPHTDIQLGLTVGYAHQPIRGLTPVLSPLLPEEKNVPAAQGCSHVSGASVSITH